MIRHSLCSLFLIASVAVPAQAQVLSAPPSPVTIVPPATAPEPLATPQGTPKPAPRVATTVGQPPAAPQPAPAPGPPRRRGRDVNVQIELTISDQVGAAKPETRVVSMIVADGAFGRVRSSADNNIEKLNIDARPELLEGDRLSVELTVEYVPPRAEGAQRRPAMLNEMLTVILQSGKPLLVSQAADPLADRKTTVEVRATIVK